MRRIHWRLESGTVGIGSVPQTVPDLLLLWLLVQLGVVRSLILRLSVRSSLVLVHFLRLFCVRSLVLLRLCVRSLILVDFLRLFCVRFLIFFFFWVFFVVEFCVLFIVLECIVVHSLVWRSLVRDDGNGRRGNLGDGGSMDGERIVEVGQLVGVDDAVFIGIKGIIGGVVGAVEVMVVGVVIHGVVGTPFHDEPASLDEELLFKLCESFNLRNGSGGDREFLQAMSGDAKTSDEQQEMIVSLFVSGGEECNGAEGPGTKRVGWIEIIEQLNVGAEFQGETGKIRTRGSGDKGQRTDGVGDAVGGREHVEAKGHVIQHGDQEQLWKAPERQTVCAGACALLVGCAVCTFDLADMAVGSDNLEMDGDVISDTLKLMIGVDVTDLETAMHVQLNDLAKLGEDGAMFVVPDVLDSPEHEVPRNLYERKADLEQTGSRRKGRRAGSVLGCGEARKLT